MSKIIPVFTLQNIVDTYNDPAVVITANFEIIHANRAYLELYNIKNSRQNSEISGDTVVWNKTSYCYEISHQYSHCCDQEGESCPLQLAQATQHNQRVLHVHHTRYGEEHIDILLYPVKDNSGQLYYLEVMKTLKHASAKSVAKGLVGKSPAFNTMVGLINRVADYDISVLLQGESGTGKELAAHAIHQSSMRKAQSCVTVECSGLSESLFESELFGHEKGSFTGAVNKKKGLVEEAEGGTLFLDEIGDVPLTLQVKLLRLIETRTFRRVGGVEQLNTDFRLICATHKNLREMVNKGEFREDLYYRISTFPIKLPPLRERVEDIPLLVDTILERISGQQKMSVAKEVLAFFSQYHFPGNIRELRNILDLGRVMTDFNLIDLSHLPESLFINEFDSASAFDRASIKVPSATAFMQTIKMDNKLIDQLPSLEQHEKDYLLWLKQYFSGDKKMLAEQLGISERTLYRKLKESGSDE